MKTFLIIIVFFYAANTSPGKSVAIESLAFSDKYSCQIAAAELRTDTKPIGNFAWYKHQIFAYCVEEQVK